MPHWSLKRWGLVVFSIGLLGMLVYLMVVYYRQERYREDFRQGIRNCAREVRAGREKELATRLEPLFQEANGYQRMTIDECAVAFLKATELPAKGEGNQ